MKLDSTVPDSMADIPISPQFPYASLRGRFSLSAYVEIDLGGTHGRPVADAVTEAVRGGATFIQLQAKGADARTFTALASSAAVAIANAGVRESVPLVVGERVDVAWQCRRMGIKVDGAHIGQGDLQPEQARAMLGPDAILGLSVGLTREVEAANALPEGCVDYLSVGRLDGPVVAGAGADAGIDASAGSEGGNHGEDRGKSRQAAESLSALRSLSRLPVVVRG